MSHEFFDPTFTAPGAGMEFVPRPQQLDGLRIGIINNRKNNALAILKGIAGHLESRWGMTVAHVADKESPAHGVSEEELAVLLKDCDFVLAGVGD